MLYICGNKQSNMENYYIVQYNDSYGNGTDKDIECLVKSKEDFDLWLSKHNEERENDGNEPEDEDEFDLIPITLFNPKN